MNAAAALPSAWRGGIGVLAAVVPVAALLSVIAAVWLPAPAEVALQAEAFARFIRLIIAVLTMEPVIAVAGGVLLVASAVYIALDWRGFLTVLEICILVEALADLYRTYWPPVWLLLVFGPVFVIVFSEADWRGRLALTAMVVVPWLRPDLADALQAAWNLAGG
ncbi:MAG: hypothetical protein J0H82_27105 [Alphaproteobacteria bacterium]|nr:hypothetical protein [Alphaproteobacteria bacterium]